ncbi:MAG TPA: hypothetical protein PKA13_15285 [Geminicoccaceae bacterium]|nr:hypothetical protein [Geminicoccus sp.]HMU51138.1 hypothetical protein [Geminicoccaceae bacterium]
MLFVIVMDKHYVGVNSGRKGGFSMASAATCQVARNVSQINRIGRGMIAT